MFFLLAIVNSTVIDFKVLKWECWTKQLRREIPRANIVRKFLYALRWISAYRGSNYFSGAILINCLAFHRRNWEGELQASTFWREIKVVHLLRNASGNAREWCSEEIATKEMKYELEKKRFLYIVRPLLKKVPDVLTLNPFRKMCQL